LPGNGFSDKVRTIIVIVDLPTPGREQREDDADVWRHCGDDQGGGKRGGDVGVVGQKFEVQNIKEAEWELNPHTGLPGNRFRGFDHRPGLELADFRKGVIEERGGKRGGDVGGWIKLV
jgi:hypothetical protein